MFSRKCVLYQSGLVMILSVILVSLLSFVLMRLSPVDPATAYVMRSSAIVTQEQIEEARVLLGMDKPFMVQYLTWLTNAMKGDLGTSLSTGKPVLWELSKAVPVSFRVVGLSGILMILGALFLGCLQYFLKGTLLEGLLRSLSIVAVAVPPFYIAIVLISGLLYQSDVFSITGNSGLMKYLPSALCLSVSGIGFYSQLIVKRLKTEMTQDYIFFGACRGLSDKRLLIGHALPSAIVDLAPSFAQMVGLILAGAVVVERVFSLPGFGDLIIESVIQRDTPVIHGSVLTLAIVLVLLNFLAEMIQHHFDGRSSTKEVGE